MSAPLTVDRIRETLRDCVQIADDAVRTVPRPRHIRLLDLDLKELRVQASALRDAALYLVSLVEEATDIVLEEQAEIAADAMADLKLDQGREA